MLVSLAVRDIVLIERLDLGFGPGLTVLTGETGAGKSIILDALGLALGERAERGLLRTGAGQGSVVAAFEPPPDHPVRALLDEHGLPDDDVLILRRTLGTDGRSRGFVNDAPVSTGTLRRLAETLVEVHGQQDQRGLLDARTHRGLLDAFGGHDADLARTRERFQHWRDTRRKLEEERRAVEAARREEEYLRHRLTELQDLAPEAGEEEALAARRTRMMHAEKLAGLMQEALEALNGRGGGVERLGAAQRRLERAPEEVRGTLEPAEAALERALIEAGEAEAQLEQALRDLELDPGTLERTETRLFALKDMARKHRVAVDELPALLTRTEEEIARIDASVDALDRLGREEAAARAAYIDAAEALSDKRRQAADALAHAVQAELAPLKLDRARLEVRLEPLDEADFGPEGRERVGFLVTTNPGQPPGPIARIASGGELSRFMLALKVVLARLGTAGTLIFDEVDAGIGGATADAVGERLARLARERQVLVVTHAPQVAARADDHFTVAKAADGARVEVDVRRLDAPRRRDEIARMLAGAEVTEAARAAADSLIGVGGRG